MHANRLKESPSQTAGPYVHIGCTPNFAGVTGVYDKDPGSNMRATLPKGEEITVTGTIFDGQGAPLTDALVEIWQADSAGHFAKGWGRCPADQQTGSWRFDTVRPAAPKEGAAHITFWIVARGINIGLHTRLYFDDETDANAVDPILSRLTAERAQTLLAKSKRDGIYHFDIYLQGDNETVFLDM